MKDPSKPSEDSLQTHKTQSTAEQTMERLIFSLSELEHLGQTLISGHSNFNHSSKTYLRITLGTLQIRRGAILRYHPTGQNLDVVAATPDETFSPILVEPDELEALLKHPFIENAAPPESLKQFFARSAKLSETIDIRLWIPLKIQDEFLGMIGLGKFLARDALETWGKGVTDNPCIPNFDCDCLFTDGRGHPERKVSVVHARGKRAANLSTATT